MHHRLPAAAALTTAFYAAPQEPADAQRLLAAAVAAAGYDREIPTPLRPSRGAGSTLVLAREWGWSELEDRLVDAIEASYEPTWQRDRGEFTWGLGLDEPHPRGQFNAFLAAAEAAGPGRWTGLSAAPLAPCPQVVGVDAPDVVLTRAEWVRDALYLTLDVAEPDPRARTEFRIVGAEPRLWDISGIPGVTDDVSRDGITVRCPKVSGDIVFTPGSY